MAIAKYNKAIFLEVLVRLLTLSWQRKDLLLYCLNPSGNRCLLRAELYQLRHQDPVSYRGRDPIFDGRTSALAWRFPIDDLRPASTGKGLSYKSNRA